MEKVFNGFKSLKEIKNLVNSSCIIDYIEDEDKDQIFNCQSEDLINEIINEIMDRGIISIEELSDSIPYPIIVNKNNNSEIFVDGLSEGYGNNHSYKKYLYFT